MANHLPHRFTGGLLLLVTLWVSGCVTTETPSPKAKASPATGAAQCQTAPSLPGVDELSTPTGDLGQLTPGQTNLSKALAYYVSGLLHLSKGETDEFLGDWEKVVQLDPTREELREKLANEYFRRKDFKKMAGILKLAVEQSPKSAPYWTLLAVAYRADRQWEPAKSAAEQAIALEPSLFPPL